MKAQRKSADRAAVTAAGTLLSGGGGAHARSEIRDLISFRIHAVANLLSRGAALTYRREFGVSLMEWRTLALLGAHQPLSLNELARHAGLDKSQMSRVVAGLTERGLVLRGMDSRDGRGVRLTLTRAGLAMYEGLIASANRRNDAFAAVLNPSERTALDDMLARLADKARELIHTERAATAAAPRKTTRKETS
jgi:DNA-binding MarR family transcriptional regulator